MKHELTLQTDLPRNMNSLNKQICHEARTHLTNRFAMKHELTLQTDLP